MRREHKKKLSKAELASITSSRPVVRKVSRRRDNSTPPDAWKKFLPEPQTYVRT